jgi:hypothetical protein
MTQESHKMSPSAIRSSSPVRPKAQAEEHPNTGSSASNRGTDEIFRIKVRVHPLPPAILSEDNFGEPTPVFSVATPSVGGTCERTPSTPTFESSLT